MANVYLQFSVAITVDTEEERQWWKTIIGLNEDDFIEFIANERGCSFEEALATIQEDALSLDEEVEYADKFIGQYSSAQASDQALESLYNGYWPQAMIQIFENDQEVVIFAEEYGDPEATAHIISKYFETFRPTDRVVFGYAETCSRPRPFHFGGGAIAVTADTVKVFYGNYLAEKWLEENV